MMGKYALYVWPAYGISAVVVGLMTLDTLLRARKWRLEVKRREEQLSKAQENNKP